jgi:hypothetical protein
MNGFCNFSTIFNGRQHLALHDDEMAAFLRFLVAVALVSMVVACGPDSEQMVRDAERQRKRTERENARALEAQMMNDKTLARLEFKRRLAAHVERTGPLLRVGNRILPSSIFEALSYPVPQEFSLAAIPVTTSWAVRCTRTGLNVTFAGTSSGEITEGSGDVSADLVVMLTNAKLSEQQCAELVAIAGEAVLEIVEGLSR